MLEGARRSAALRRTAALALCLGLALAGADARAGAPSDVAVAEALFREGRALVADGKLAEACAKFAESQRLDPAPGTILNLGDCYERRGLYASAWGAYVSSVDEAKRAGRADQAEIAAARARDVEAKVPYLVVQVPAPSDVDGLTVTDNGAAVPRGQWGSALPVDPGEHEIVASARGRRPRSLRVQIAPIAAAARPRTTTVIVEPLEPESATAAAPPVERPIAGLPTAPAPPAWSAQKTGGVLAGAAGVAALAAGTVLGVLALGRDEGARDAGCDDRVCFTDRGRELTVEARRLATASTWLFVGGATLTIAGATVFFTAPAGPRGQVSGATFGARGRW